MLWEVKFRIGQSECAINTWYSAIDPCFSKNKKECWIFVHNPEMPYGMLYQIASSILQASIDSKNRTCFSWNFHWHSLVHLNRYTYIGHFILQFFRKHEKVVNKNSALFFNKDKLQNIKCLLFIYFDQFWISSPTEWCWSVKIKSFLSRYFMAS